MSLHYQPREGSVLICDFRGYEVPEMVKVRPVVVIRRHRSNRHLVTVVPLSTTAPELVLGHHLQLANRLQGRQLICWAKCDMLATVGLPRLDRIRRKDRHGRRIYEVLQLSDEELAAVKAAVRKALGV
ncbi:type II toxin-antitoxin system PemK/MazF family toxin [Pseudomonas sp. NPDC089530]|uniref:type II toxin-antitoxin system PemK/MazF family toxin n=1 Tax=Pseudomonas sp. NPDC089530 TaxID=3390651 RepID=UPI003CFE9356